MAHSLTIIPATGTLLPTRSNETKTPPLRCVPSPRFRRVSTCHGDSSSFSHSKLASRRAVSLGLAVAMVGLNIGGESANAAARRPLPPPPEEKRDPNVSGVLAKVQASKRRKEAMKEEVAKLREKGKIIPEPSDKE